MIEVKVICRGDELMLPLLKGMGIVYILEREDKMVKIGISNDFEQRVRNIEMQGGIKIAKSYSSVPCYNYKDLEKKMHYHFKGNRVIGEWFNISFDKACKHLDKQEFKLDPDGNQNDCSWLNTADILADSFMKSDLDLGLFMKEKIELERGNIEKAMDYCMLRTINILRRQGKTEEEISRWFDEKLKEG